MRKTASTLLAVWLCLMTLSTPCASEGTRHAESDAGAPRIAISAQYMSEGGGDEAQEGASLTDLKASVDYLYAKQPCSIAFTARCALGPDAPPVQLLDQADNPVGTMHDDGEDGDEAEGDGVYTLILPDCVSEEPGALSFYARAGAAVSEKVWLAVYGATDDAAPQVSAAQRYAVRDAIREAEAPLKDPSGYVRYEDIPQIMSELKTRLDSLQSSGTILFYEADERSAFIKLPSGVAMVYEPRLEGCSAGGNPAITGIRAIHPDRKIFDQYYGAQLIDAMQAIDEEMDTCSFDVDLRFEDVTVDELKKGFDGGIIVWNGHGGHGPIVKSYLLTDEAYSEAREKSDAQYREDIKTNRIIVSDNDTLAITSKFVRHYWKRLKGSVVILAACKSAEDDRLANAFIDNGAKAVLGFTDTVMTAYAVKYTYAVLLCMATIDPDTGEYYTLESAVAFATALCGGSDVAYWRYYNSKREDDLRKTKHPIARFLEPDAACPKMIGDGTAQMRRAANVRLIATDTEGNAIDGAEVKLDNVDHVYQLTVNLDQTNATSLDKHRAAAHIPADHMKNAFRIPEEDYGAFMMTLSAEHYEARQETIKVLRPMDENYTLKLLGEYDGMVVDKETGAPLEGVQVTCALDTPEHPDGALFPRTTTTGGEGAGKGACAFRGLDTGDYTMVFKKEGYKDETRSYHFCGSDNQWSIDDTIQMKPDVRIELSPYLDQPLGAAAADIGGLEKKIDNTMEGLGVFQYGDDAVSLEGYDGSAGEVASIVLSGPGNYALFGMYVGMDEAFVGQLLGKYESRRDEWSDAECEYYLVTDHRDAFDVYLIVHCRQGKITCVIYQWGVN